MEWYVVSMITLFFSYLTFSCAGKSKEKTLPQLTIPAIITSGVNSTVVPCPDPRFYCRDGSTCCTYVTYGLLRYRCCPFRRAVCCSDNIHCCRPGRVCDTTTRRCLLGSLATEAKDASVLRTIKVVKSAVDARIVTCPDGRSDCPDSTTCCKRSSGEDGCCPLPNAVCCSDGGHCCPEGYTCDVKEGKCNKIEERIKMVGHTPSLRSSVDAQYKYISCPEGCSCLEYQTCCQLSDGLHGCCPYSDAVCCSDHEHCCPSGHRCDLTTQMCVLGNVYLPMLQKTKCVHAQKTRKVNINEILRFNIQDGEHVADDTLQ